MLYWSSETNSWLADNLKFEGEDYYYIYFTTTHLTDFAITTKENPPKGVL